MAGELFTFGVLASAVIVGILALTAYRALAIRRSLAVGLYRRQALWAGTIASIYVVLFGLNLPFVYLVPLNAWVDLAFSFLQDVGIIMLFAWIDASTQIARRSDPLLRDSVRWTKIRRPIWALLLISLLSAWYFAIGHVLGGGSLSTAPALPGLVALLILLMTPFLTGVVTIPTSAARSGDPVFRRHLKWFSVTMVAFVTIAFYFGALLLSGTAYGYLDLLRAVLNQPAQTVFLFTLGLVLAYSLYRSVQSLAPINKLLAER